MKTIKNNIMERKEKILYEAPVAILVEVKFESGLCQSELNGMTDPDDYDFGVDPFDF